MNTEPWAEESDAYFKRNGDHETRDADPLLTYLHSLDVKDKKILDVGCFTGERLFRMKERGAVCFGTEPSALAVEKGNVMYPGISIQQGFSHSLPFEDSSFDLITINLVFSWVKRDNLLRTVSEIDRVLKNGGTLIIGDFYPPESYKRPYKHKEGLYTYKQRYWEMFTASNLYTIADKIPFAVGGAVRDDSIEPGDNSNIEMVLTKNLEDNYPVKEF